MANRMKKRNVDVDANGNPLVMQKPAEEVALLLELNQTKDRLEESLRERQELADANKKLANQLTQQQDDQADIFAHLNQKIDRSLDQVNALERERESLRKDSEQKLASLAKQLENERAAASSQKATMQQKIDSLSSELMELLSFSKMKKEYENEIQQLKQELQKERDNHKQEIADIELKKVQEKERLKQEMLIKIKETKKNLLTMTENQLDTTTKRTVLENEHMATELQYQSKETERILKNLAKIERENQELRRELEILNSEKLGHAKKANFYWNLSQAFTNTTTTTHLNEEKPAHPEQQQQQEQTVVVDAPPNKNEEKKREDDQAQQQNYRETNANANATKRLGTLLKENNQIREENAQLKEITDGSVALLEYFLDAACDHIKQEHKQLLAGLVDTLKTGPINLTPNPSAGTTRNAANNTTKVTQLRPRKPVHRANTIVPSTRSPKTKAMRPAMHPVMSAVREWPTK